MLKAVPSHSNSAISSSSPQTCNGITVNGTPCKQIVANGCYSKDGLVFCHNHQRQAREGSMFLKERWDSENPNRAAAVTGKIKNNNYSSLTRPGNDDGSMRQLITQFKRLFHSSSAAASASHAAVAKHSSPVTHNHQPLPQARRPLPQPLQPPTRIELPPSVLPITPSTPITEKVPVLRQCQAINRNNGRQCSRVFKDDCEHFCFQHRKVSLKDHAHIRDQQLQPNTLIKDFARYIPDHLSSNIKKLLYQELSKPLSQSDSPGYIYTYMLTSSSTATHALFKIGRTKNLHRRMYQWVSKCEYVPKLVECFPRTEDEEQVRYSHRVERLIHIELSDRYRADAETCGGCGGVHREWFKVARARGMSDRDMWLVLREVVVRWVNYIAKVSSP